jgi:hypothetical protein
MPFITGEARRMTDTIGPKVRGDACFLKYRPMIRAWRKSPHWTTVDELAEGLFPDPDKRAEFLAFLVFFLSNAWPYEQLKRTENGEVDY